MKWWIGGVLAVLLACATSPTGRRQLVLLPESQMSAMGEEAFTQMKASEPTAEAGPSVEYARCIADAILEAAKLDADQSWEVVVFESEQVNAFALPGGKIGIYTGMMRFAATPSELAAVVGHEIGHVIAQHGNERVSESVVAQGIQGALASITDVENSQTGQLLMAGLGLGYQYGIALPHSRTQEEEADVIGLRLMARAGFDPSEAVSLWERMASRGQGPPEFLSTHPDPSRRAEYLRDMQDDVASEVEAAREAGRRPNCRRPDFGPPPSS
jgi:predicted Zn-dependent protease